MTDRDFLTKIEKQVDLYLKINKLNEAYQIVSSAIRSYPEAANLYFYRGRISVRQSKFPEAIKDFSVAISINPDYTEASLNLCIVLCDIGQYDEAQEIFRRLKEHTKAKHSVPRSIRGKIANAHYENGKIYYSAKLYQEAASEFNKALSLFERMPDAKIDLAKVYLATAQIGKCQRELLETIKLEPANDKALSMMGVSLFHNGDIDSARDYFKRAKDANPSAKLPKAFLKLCKSSAN